MAELSGGAVQHIQPAGGADPQMTGLILQDRAHIVAGERGGLRRIVTKDLRHPAFAVQPIKTPIEGADPQGAALVLEHPGDLVAAQGARIAGLVTIMDERALLGLPAIEPDFRADPQHPRTVERQSGNPVVAERVRIVGIMAQMLDAAGCRLENVDARIGCSHPDAIARIDQHGVHGVAGE
jgi:hypothetical protein